MKTKKNTFGILCLFVFLLAFICQPTSASPAKVHVPEPLAPWVDWVLHGKEEQLTCIPQYNDANAYLCAWPSVLDMVFTDQGGEFSQTWLVHKESWVSLPGSPERWPGNVAVNGTQATVLEKNKAPGILLPPGFHNVTGGFAWKGLPERLDIPPTSGLVSLTVNNENVAFPNLDASGRLWLKRVVTDEKIENHLKIESFRLIDDAIPAMVTLHFTLDVAGSAREITFGPLYASEKFTPLSIESLLPVKLEADGRMRVQVRPGQYRIRVGLRHSGPLETLSFVAPADDFWPRREIWSFKAQPQLRLVEIIGVAAIDPVRTSMPPDWHNYPAYSVSPDESMGFKEIKRGDPQPAPDRLALERSIWLRFDGQGYTLQDRITGRKNTNWRLEANPAIALGRVSVDGIAQLITKRTESDKAGVELRNGILNLTADSLYTGDISSLPATGWDHDFQQVMGRLNLPPGWTLLGATGIDTIPGTWVKQWTLLDIFIVLVFTVALAKLFSKPLAGLAFLTLVLTYHEPGAPRYVWPALLIGFALLKYLPDGKFKTAVKVYQATALLVLVVIAIPYAVSAIRTGIYPQLARPWTSMTEYALQQTATRAPVPMDTSQMEVMEEDYAQERESRSRPGARKTLSDATGALLKSRVSGTNDFPYSTQVMQYDPKALTQTGPGMPGWLPFETIDFGWTGPVTRDQNISFFLMGPKTNLFLAFIRVFLIFLLGVGMTGIKFRFENGFRFTVPKSLSLMALFILLAMNPGASHGTEMPSAEILAELQNRLLEKDECFPACADIAVMHISISPKALLIEMTIDARVDTAVPVPSHGDHWMPNSVMIDDRPIQGLLRQNNALWMLMPAGKHKVSMTGLVGKQNTFQIPFVLKPRQAVVTTDGWSVEGVRVDGTLDAQLQFKRIVEQASQQVEILETGVLPSFVLVERNILLGLDWKIQTRVQRLSAPGTGILVDIPLIPGESVTTENIRVINGTAKISMGANQNQTIWESFLEPSDQILLSHRETSDWTEIWKVDVSPIWHLEYEGVPVIFHKTGTRWYPTWHPWPGETVTLNIFRPAGIEGRTLTIEKSHLELRPGQKTTAASLLFSANSSQGGQHTVLLPEDAQLQEVIIQGSARPIHQEGRQVTLPIIPGNQDIMLKWIESRGMETLFRTSRIDLGAPSVNASVDIFLSKNRWPLFAGGDHPAGPAVLFWSVLFMILMVALGLFLTRWTPLRLHHWILLGIGMSMGNMAAGLIVTGWLVALGHRKKGAGLEGQSFNFMQMGLAALTFIALCALVFAISNGLLGHPDMNITGNGSNSGLLRWYQDVSDHALPMAWVFSIPMVIYRIAMLAWALWLSFWLVGILKWGWKEFSQPRLWITLPAKNKKKKNAKIEPVAAEPDREEEFDLP